MYLFAGAGGEDADSGRATCPPRLPHVPPRTATRERQRLLWVAGFWHHPWPQAETVAAGGLFYSINLSKSHFVSLLKLRCENKERLNGTKPFSWSTFCSSNSHKAHTYCIVSDFMTTHRCILSVKIHSTCKYWVLHNVWDVCTCHLDTVGSRLRFGTELFSRTLTLISEFCGNAIRPLAKDVLGFESFCSFNAAKQVRLLERWSKEAVVCVDETSRFSRFVGSAFRLFCFLFSFASAVLFCNVGWQSSKQHFPVVPRAVPLTWQT